MKVVFLFKIVLVEIWFVLVSGSVTQFSELVVSFGWLAVSVRASNCTITYCGGHLPLRQVGS